MTHLEIGLVGFGNVGRAFARLLLRKRVELKEKFQISVQVNGIATHRHGIVIDPGGIDLIQALELVETGQSLSQLNQHSLINTIFEFIQDLPAQVLFENTPVNHQTGQPAVDYLKAGLKRGMHVITANKGPVVHGFVELNDLANTVGKRFLFESAVMDGAPIFSLFRGSLPAANLLGFQGILNSCTNLIIGRMETSESLEEAVTYAQSVGITETDPSADIDGWDAAIKVAALSTVLLGIPLKPQDIDRTGIRYISPAMLAEARLSGTRWKLLCSCIRRGDGVEARVHPEQVRWDSPLYSINGASSYVQFELDVLPGLGIVESDPGPETTAYGLLADLINTVRGI